MTPGREWESLRLTVTRRSDRAPPGDRQEAVGEDGNWKGKSVIKDRTADNLFFNADNYLFNLLSVSRNRYFLAVACFTASFIVYWCSPYLLSNMFFFCLFSLIFLYIKIFLCPSQKPVFLSKQKSINSVTCLLGRRSKGEM